MRSNEAIKGWQWRRRRWRRWCCNGRWLTISMVDADVYVHVYVYVYAYVYVYVDVDVDADAMSM